MPDNVAFCPGCGRRMWVPGRETTKPAPSPPLARTPAAHVPVSKPAASTTIRPKDNLIGEHFAMLVTTLALATIVAAIAMRLSYSLLALIPVLGYLLAWLTTAVALLGWIILWLVLVVKALQGESFKLPWIGPLAEKV